MSVLLKLLAFMWGVAAVAVTLFLCIVVLRWERDPLQLAIPCFVYFAIIMANMSKAYDDCEGALLDGSISLFGLMIKSAILLGLIFGATVAVVWWASRHMNGVTGFYWLAAIVACVFAPFLLPFIIAAPVRDRQIRSGFGSGGGGRGSRPGRRD